MIEKIRPNVMVLATIAGTLTLIFGWLLINRLTIDNAEATLAIVAVLSMIVGIGIGGIMTLAGQVASDPPPPTVPAGTHERMMKVAKGD